MSNARILCTTQELADHVGLTIQRINQYAVLGMPKEKRNKFELHTCCRWIQNYETELWEKKFRDSDKQSDWYRENARLTKLKADMAQDKLYESRRQLIPLSQLLPIIERLLGAFKDNLLGLGTKLAQQLEGKKAIEVRKLIDDDIRDRLTKLSQASIDAMDLRRLQPTDEVAPAPGRSTAKKNAVRVGRRAKGHKSGNKSKRIRKVGHKPG